MKFKRVIIGLLLSATTMVGCAENTFTPDTGRLEVSDEAATKGGVDGKQDASVLAVFLDFEFSGELLTTSSYNADRRIEDQLLYTIGQLNGDNSVGRIDSLKLSNIETTNQDGKVVISYDASMLVAWGKRDNIPATYTLKMPRDMSHNAMETFVERYGRDCVDWSASGVDASSMWYYYRPEASRCRLDDNDIIKLEARTSPSDVQTTGKYPEYHKVWEDNLLKVVAVFGKDKADSTSNFDAGISAYNRFVNAAKRGLSQYDTQSTPESLPSSPGVEHPEVVFQAELENGKQVRIVALLVDNVRTAGETFNRRYHEVSRSADLIVYNGHSGLGANIRALAQKGNWVQGQYSIVYMNGCDTYAYIDASLNEARAAVNPDDPEGTKHLDLVLNAMPSYFSEMEKSTMMMINALINYENPMTYEQIFQSVDRRQVIIVSGEQDNEFVPGMMDDRDTDIVVEDWKGLSAEGTVSRQEEHHFDTPLLEAGTYLFEMTGTNDADLFVRIGDTPTDAYFDCRPFRSGSNETCRVELPSPATIHVMVRGWAPSSDYELNAKRVSGN